MIGLQTFIKSNQKAFVPPNLWLTTTNKDVGPGCILQAVCGCDDAACVSTEPVSSPRVYDEHALTTSQEVHRPLDAPGEKAESPPLTYPNV